MDHPVYASPLGLKHLNPSSLVRGHSAGSYRLIFLSIIGLKQCSNRAIARLLLAISAFPFCLLVTRWLAMMGLALHHEQASGVRLQ